MKFVDEVTIHVAAGGGGHGGLSFRREKYVPRGGPDGGDGGNGGDIILQGDESINSLVDFRYKRHFNGERGVDGMGKQRTGKSGVDLIVPVPVGTLVRSAETGELIGDITADGQQLVVARGGHGGKGNTRFKSSVNRAPRRTTQGTPGETRDLHLELKLLADVGLLGFPNAGKSTLISAISAATPKVADYPFTTLYPNLGVVRLEQGRSFVVADVPGLIEGAAEGAGLGITFLKHIQRTRLLFHLVDIAPIDGTDPAEQVRRIEAELLRFDPALMDKPRWLVLTKADLVESSEQESRAREVVRALDWTAPWYLVSSISHSGTDQLVADAMTYLEQMDDSEGETAPASEDDQDRP